MATRPTRTLAYGQQRLLEIALALAPRPRVLLLDEPAAGVPKDESAALFAVIAALPADIAVLFIEHDMDIVFRFATRIIVLVAGAVLLEADPATVRVRPARARGLPRPGRPCLSRCSSSATSAPATATPSSSTASRSRCPPTAASPSSAATASARRRCCSTIMGFVPLARGSVHFRGRDISRLPPHARARLGLGWVPQERDIFPSLTVEENLTVAARPGRWDLAAIYGLFPRLQERRGNMGNQLSGGEQQMLAIARTLTTNPSVLLLDEPLEGLAPIVVEELTAAIARMTAATRASPWCWSSSTPGSRSA